MTSLDSMTDFLFLIVQITVTKWASRIADPHYFGKLDPDQHYSEKLDLDPH